MAKTQFLTFEIHLRDADRVAELQGAPPGETSAQGAQIAIIRAPAGAAIEFGNSDNGGVPLPLVARFDAIPDGPYIYSEWFAAGNAEWGVNFPVDVATFERKSGGWFGISALFGQTTRFYWRGVFIYDAPLEDTEPGGTAERDRIAKRRWVDPFAGNMAETASSGSSPGQRSFSRDAGRHPDTIGFAYRGLTGERQHQVMENLGGGASTQRNSWERLYIRIRKPALGMVWRAAGSNLPFGAQIDLTPTGQLAVYNIASGPTKVLIGTSEALDLNRWYKLDILLKFGGAGMAPFAAGDTDGRLRLFLNGLEILNFTSSPTVGIGNTNTHSASFLGEGVTRDAEIDFGFWMNAEYPKKADGTFGEPPLNGIDFVNGSRAVVIRPTGFAAGHGTWVGDWRLLSQQPTRDASQTPPVVQKLTSSTALDELQVTTDAPTALTIPQSLGMVAFTLCQQGHSNSGASGKLAYKINADARVEIQMGAGGVLAEAVGSAGWVTALHAPSNVALPTPITALELHRVKSNDAVLSATVHLTAVAEVIGTFGQEDYDPSLPTELQMPFPELGHHNAPYPASPWARSVSPPFSPVIIHAGTYLGNGTAQDLAFRAPVHWLWIRREAAAGALGARWWSTMLGPTFRGAQTPTPHLVPNALIDPDFGVPAEEEDQSQQTLVRIAGADPETNQSGQTYVYLAFEDPGQRFMIAGALMHGDANMPAVHALLNVDFAAQAAFLFHHGMGNDLTDFMAFKGPGHAADALSRLDDAGTLVPDGLSLGVGELTLRAGFGPTTFVQAAYALFRQDDNSGDPGVHRVIKTGSYVGTGAGTLLVSLTPASGRRPLWAIVAPNGAMAHYKDGNHTGGNSNAMNGLQATNGIISGGIDQITVGTALNASGKLYNYFIFMGGEDGGPDGFSVLGEFIPVEPTSPADGPYGEDPEEPGEDGDEPGADTPGNPGGGDDDIATDLLPACVPFTKRVMNQALTRIGVSKRIVDAALDNTEEADVLRGAYAQAVEETLHDHPWPFATRYADLVLLSGSVATPVNRDWTFAYQQPSDCVFERRIVVVREGAVDPTPPPMQLSFSNASGNRIFTNESNARLEYTARPECSAGRGDPLFLEALIWKLASKAAGPLTRVASVTQLCETQYAQAIDKARAILRPGNPGPRTDIDALALDPGDGALAANIAVVNRALIRIGAQTIANLATEQSREAEAARLIFEEELRSTLRDYPWAFATVYEPAPVLVGGTAMVGYNDDWQFAYRYPSDALKIRRIVTEHRRSRSERDPEMFRVGRDSGGNLIFSNRENPTFEYTARIPDCVLHADTLFRDAFAWRLAASLAPSLATVDPDTTEQLGRGPQERPKERKALEVQLRERATNAAWRQYYLVLEKARIADASEQQQDPQDIDADWIRGRS
jgi:hypothetical protein